jgi:hypothetical protein
LGDPDNPRHNIQLKDAIALDRACIAAQYPPPLLRAYELALQADDTDIGTNRDADTCHLALAMEVAAGLVGEAILQADSCGSCDCPRGYHANRVSERLLDLEHAIAQLRKAVAEREAAAG